MGAGEPLTDDVLKCQLQPMDPTAYFPVLFSDAQWAQLQAAFPGGVCDYTKPGVNHHPTVPWLTYANGPAGTPPGAAPSPPTSPCVGPGGPLLPGPPPAGGACAGAPRVGP